MPKYNDVNLDIINDKELLKLFNELDVRVQSRVINAGFRKAANLIMKQAKANLKQIKKGKSKTGYANINRIFKIQPLKSDGNIGVKAGITKEGYKYRWLNWGTDNRKYTIKKRKFFKKNNVKEHNTGLIKPSHFFSNAVDSTKGEAQKNVNEAIINSLKNVIRKYERGK